MGFIEGVKERCLPVRMAILENPFVVGIGQGHLDVELMNGNEGVLGGSGDVAEQARGAGSYIREVYYVY